MRPALPDLLDVSVWLPLSAPDHVHHARARRYWDTGSADQLAFCRVTALAFLRLTTNATVLGDAVLDGPSAWRGLRTWLDSPRVVFINEPPGIDEVLGRWVMEMDIHGGHWTDAYLAAFAVAAGCRLVSFDSDFKAYSGLSFIRLADDAPNVPD